MPANYGSPTNILRNARPNELWMEPKDRMGSRKIFCQVEPTEIQDSEVTSIDSFPLSFLRELSKTRNWRRPMFN